MTDTYTQFPLRLNNARCYEETGREMWVFQRGEWGVDGLERTTKAEASKISLFFMEVKEVQFFPYVFAVHP